ncbi:MAG: hypothetical protein WCA49_02870 [Candidatus Sulfotelmatobacter sp.]
MGIDLVALDDKIKKLQLIRQLASDPDVASLLADIVTGNGVAAHKPQTPPAERKGVRYDVLKYVVHPSTLEDFTTARQITEKMEKAKYEFKSKKHLVTVKESLRELEKEGLVEKHDKRTEIGAAQWKRTV